MFLGEKGAPRDGFPGRGQTPWSDQGWGNQSLGLNQPLLILEPKWSGWFRPWVPPKTPSLLFLVLKQKIVKTITLRFIWIHNFLSFKTSQLGPPSTHNTTIDVEQLQGNWTTYVNHICIVQISGPEVSEGSNLISMRYCSPGQCLSFSRCRIFKCHCI